MTTSNNQHIRVSLQEPLLYIYHTIPSGEDRAGAWTTDALRFRWRIALTEEVLSKSLNKKIEHCKICRRFDHSQCFGKKYFQFV